MKRPQGNILRPPGSKYLNDKRCQPGLESLMHRAVDLRIKSGVSQDGTVAPLAWLTH